MSWELCCYVICKKLLESDGPDFFLIKADILLHIIWIVGEKPAVKKASRTNCHGSRTIKTQNHLMHTFFILNSLTFYRNFVLCKLICMYSWKSFDLNLDLNFFAWLDDVFYIEIDMWSQIRYSVPWINNWVPWYWMRYNSMHWNNALGFYFHIQLGAIIIRSSITWYWIHQCSYWSRICCQTSNISCTLVGNKFVDHSDVVGALPVGDAPSTSLFST